jgi:integrase
MRKRGKDRQPLTVVTVEKLRRPGRYGDVKATGLYLAVSKTGAKSWIFIGARHGKRHVVGLGPAKGDSAVSLAAARLKASDIRKKLLDGVVPTKAKAALAAAKAQRAAAEAGAVTFDQMADELFDRLSPSWRNAKHEYQWQRTLKEHCAPLREKPVSKIDVEDVLRVIGPLWNTKVETALRTRARIERVLDYAKGKGFRVGDNAATWKGNLEALLPKPRPKRERVVHLAAMNYRDLPGFMVELQAQDTVAARALEFTILTAGRSGETLGAQWNEIDLEEKLWVVPARRMKAGQEHRVPLSPRAVTILRGMEKFRANEFVFPGLRDGKPLSDMALTQMLRRLGRDVTTHGFRSTFRDWCGDCTPFPREIAEAALAHLVGDEVERAYRRGAALEKRRELMAAWANYCRPKGGNIIAMRGGSAS